MDGLVFISKKERLPVMTHGVCVCLVEGLRALHVGFLLIQDVSPCDRMTQAHSKAVFPPTIMFICMRRGGAS